MVIFIKVILGTLLNLLYKSYKLMCRYLQKYNLSSSKFIRGNLKSPNNLGVKNKIYSLLKI